MVREKQEKCSRIEEWKKKKKEKNRQKKQRHNEKNHEKRAAHAREKWQLNKPCAPQPRQQAMQAANRLKRIQGVREKKIALELKMEKRRKQTRGRVKKLEGKKEADHVGRRSRQS